MNKNKTRFFLLFTIFFISAAWSVFIPGGWEYALGLFLLGAAALFPLSGHKNSPAFHPHEPPSGPRGKVFTALVLLTAVVVCALSIAAAVLSRSENLRNRAAYDSYSVSIPETVGDYTRKAVKENDGLLVVMGATRHPMRVFGDGLELKAANARSELANNKALYYHDRKGASLIISPEIRKLEVFSHRPILKNLASPIFVFSFFLLLILLHAVQSQTSLFHRFRLTLSEPALLFFLLATGSVYFILHSYPTLYPVKFAMDGQVYLAYAGADTWNTAILSHRTPGYPYLLRSVLFLTPVSFESVIAVQYGLFLLGLSWMLLELNKLKTPAAVCFVLYLLFLDYMKTYHHFVLADSPGLSGLLLLLAASLFLCRLLLNGEGFSPKMIFASVLAAVICFGQLMIKPFPGTIFIPAGMVFLMSVFALKQWKRGFEMAIFLSVLCLLPALLFCGYRYWRCGDFNFASLSSFQMTSTAITLLDPVALRSGQMDHEAEKAVKTILYDTLPKNPELKWPVPLRDKNFKNEDFCTYANRLMYHDGLRNGHWLEDVDMSKYPSADVGIELECKKLLRQLLPFIPRENIFALQKTYLEELKIYLKYPRLCADWFAEISPFGGSPARILLMLFFPFALCLFLRRRIGFKPLLPGTFFLIALIATLGTVSTFVLVTPFIEVRREMIGLSGLFFGTWGIIAVCWYSLLFPAGVFLLQRLKKWSDAQGARK